MSSTYKYLTQNNDNLTLADYWTNNLLFFNLRIYSYCQNKNIKNT